MIEQLLEEVVITEEAHSYSPVIKKLTNKQLKQLEIKKRIAYVLKIINYILLLAVGLSFVYPFLWMVAMSLRSYADAVNFSPSIFVTDIHWENYLDAWNKAKFSSYLGNSITYAVLVLGLQYFFIVPAAFAFARMKFKGNKMLFIVKQLGMMLPAEATLIPVYFFYSKMGLVDTWTGLVLPNLFSMFSIYMFMNHFKTLPQEVIESALLDKSKNRILMLKIMVPMILPVFITNFLLSFISNWNSYYWVLVMTNTEELKTLPVAIRGLLKADGVMPPWHQVMAGNIMQLAPILLMYILGNKQMKTAMIGGRKIKFANDNKEDLFKRFINYIKSKFTSKNKNTIIKEG